jgi:calnexin
MDDPSAVKPDGWDDRRMVPDPSVTKPQGWLDKELPDIPDPTATKPDSWDEATQVIMVMGRDEYFE